MTDVQLAWKVVLVGVCEDVKNTAPLSQFCYLFVDGILCLESVKREYGYSTEYPEITVAFLCGWELSPVRRNYVGERGL